MAREHGTAGTNSTLEPTGGGPAVVLVEPQLGENIGMVARAMANCALDDLRLVNPRDGWPSDKARAAASGADWVIEGARLFETTEAAVADLERVYAATARSRDMVKEVLTPRGMARRIREWPGPSGILFGKEAKGLTNDDVALADAILQVPLNPAHSSLNLAQAVLLVGYEWYQAADSTPAEHLPHYRESRPATKEEMVGLFEHLERELDACGFLRITEKRPYMVRNLRNMFQRAGLTEQEVRTMRGVVACLVEKRKR